MFFLFVAICYNYFLNRVPACTTNQGSPQPSGNPATSTNPSEKSGFKCPTCDKVFKRESHLNQHLKVHDNKQWECDVCKKGNYIPYILGIEKYLYTNKIDKLSYSFHHQVFPKETQEIAYWRNSLCLSYLWQVFHFPTILPQAYALPH